MSISQFQLSYELSPILLTNGIAENLPNNAMPITDITEPAGTNGLTYPNYFAHFQNLPNGSLADWKIAEYPFVSLVMAANAVVQMPLKVSMAMKCPARNNPNRDYFAKKSILTSLKSQLQAHILAGGTFTVVTPAYTYTDLLLVQLSDMTSNDDKQVQSQWRWDFEQPLITTVGAQQALGTFIGKAEKGLPTTTTWDATP